MSKKPDFLQQPSRTRLVAGARYKASNETNWLKSDNATLEKHQHSCFKTQPTLTALNCPGCAWGRKTRSSKNTPFLRKRVLSRHLGKATIKTKK